MAAPHPMAKAGKSFFCRKCGDRLDMERVHFMGKVPYATFVSLMQVSRVHAYLTYPFVLSWSMLEAMAAGCFVIGSRTAPVQEVIEDGVNGRLVDFFDVPGWSDMIIKGLARPKRFVPLREARARPLWTITICAPSACRAWCALSKVSGRARARRKPLPRQTAAECLALV
jgi:glycosyltransferase involved in cell wall biosynthesis